MTDSSLRLIIGSLKDAGVRYLVVGGLAVAAHGHVRYTTDIDLILAFETENLLRALDTLKKLNYSPRAPVPIDQFANPAKRKEWQETKGLKVFSLFSPDHPQTEIDLFIDDPLGFDEAYERGMLYHYAEDLDLPVCSLGDLVKLKRAANRDKDRSDLETLKQLYPDQL